MARRTEPLFPGWYQDPEDPTRLRHWGGSGWSNARRPKPGWTVATADVSLDVAPGVDVDNQLVPTEDLLPLGDETGPGGTGPATHLARRTSTAGPRITRLDPGGQRFNPWESPAPGKPRIAQRRRVALIVTILVLIGAVSALASGVGEPSTDIPLAAVDASFVEGANQACSTSLTGLRLSGTPTMSASGAATGSAPGAPAALRAGATKIAQLASRLTALAVTASTRPEITAWLGQWSRFESARRAEAALLASPATTSSASRADQMAEQAAADAHTADRFATANDLPECTLGSPPPTSLVPIP